MFASDVVEKLRYAKQVAVITGAGISSESGIPTFRGEGGYWRNYKAEELATPSAFVKDPSLVWSWYDMRRGVCKNASPNPAHFIVAEMEKYFPSFLLITQNVDGLHRRAGSQKLVEIHGHIFTARCTVCQWKGELLDVPLLEVPPKCPVCSSLLRPHILWFGEQYDMDMIEEVYSFLQKTDLVFIIGTSGNVYTPMQMASIAMSKGAYSIEINPEPSSLSQAVDQYIPQKAGEALPILWKQVTG
jgi:NAD-dependent deacetylase